MTESNQENHGSAESEAVAWLLKLDHIQACESDLADFQLWINKHPLNAYYFHKISQAWDAAAGLLSLAEHYPHQFKAASTSANSAKARPWLRFDMPGFVKAGFAAAAVLMLAIFIFPLQREAHERMVYQTAAGEQRTFTLPDGSLVSLNTRSRISVDYTRAKRTLILEYGEGDFKVAKNKERPFLVEANKGVVMAVGTEFVVRYTDPSVGVYVNEGIVKVLSDKANVNEEFANKTLADRSGDVVVVRAGQATAYTNKVEAAKNLTASEAEKLSSWMSGSLVFNGETLGTTVGELSRYTEKKIVISDDSIKSLRVGGRYQTGDIEGLAQSLGKSLNIKVSYPDDKTIIFSK